MGMSDIFFGIGYEITLIIQQKRPKILKGAFKKEAFISQLLSNVDGIFMSLSHEVFLNVGRFLWTFCENIALAERSILVLEVYPVATRT